MRGQGLAGSEPWDHLHYVLLQDVVLHNVKDKLDVLCVCGAGEVRVDVRRTGLIDVDEHACDELPSLEVVILGT